VRGSAGDFASHPAKNILGLEYFSGELKLSAMSINMTPKRTCTNHVVQTNLVYDKYGIDRIFNVEVNGS
jgi:hypothetical protein